MDNSGIEQTCPTINKYIKNQNAAWNAMYDVFLHLKNYNPEAPTSFNADELADILHNGMDELNNIDLEYLRSANSGLRDWGIARDDEAHWLNKKLQKIDEMTSSNNDEPSLLYEAIQQIIKQS